jgi:hypothetical protein
MTESFSPWPRSLGYEHRDGSRDEKRGDQAGQNVLAGIFLKHHERFKPRLPDGGMVPGHIVAGQEGQ